MSARRACLTLLALMLAGCGAPKHVVIDNASMVIYHAEKRSDMKFGTYEYWVRDNSTVGWKFITDKEFKVGDKLEIDVVHP